MTPDPRPALRRDEVERVYRLGSAQAGMLFHDLAAPEAAPYHRQVSFLLDGRVDPERCEAAWNALMARHPLLRSSFDYERTAEPLQIVLKRRTVEFHGHDVAGPGAPAAAEAWRRAEAARGFDLVRDPLVRIALFRHGPARFEMVWSHPHILIDGWSGAVLAEEFLRVYAAEDLPPAPDPDAFLAARAARDGEAGLRHWAGLLEGYAELATLPRLAGTPAPYSPAEPHIVLDEAESDALRALAARHGATLGVMLQALWGLLLGRWTDRRDVVFGVVVSGRSLATPGVERLVGMFINTVPVRVRWADHDTIGDLLLRLQAQADAGADHDGVPLGDIGVAAGLPRLLDHLLVLENYPAGDVDEAATGFTVTHAAAAERSNYDFGLLVHAGPTIAIGFPHDAARFAPGLMARVARHLRTLVAAVLTDPCRPLAEIDSLPVDERRAIAGLACGPRVTATDDPTLADLWHAAVDRTPYAMALVAEDERLAYRTLDGLAEGVADRLRDAGIGVGDVVGVLAARGIARVAALLGILKAGAVYLPLSPALPDGRIAATLGDAGCRCALGDAAGAARLARLRPGLAMPIEGPAGCGRRASTARAGDLAYIIYTSGSTGHPKGVAVEHRGFVNMIRAQMHGFGLEEADRVLQFASCSFDASLSETFMALLAGARLVVAPEAAVRDGAALLALMAAEGVTVATLPPSYLRALDGADLGPLRVLITAGEPADTADARHHAARRRTFNAYGPSEASVCATWHRVEPDAAYPDGIPIGRPIANTALTVRDGAGRPMPFDVPGEICLSGVGLARGYVGQPGLTGERFPTIGGERLYRTGDTGLLREDGTVFYLGRRDGQVKLNGHRVELGEIEARLRADPEVIQAVAALAEEPPRLVAFVVPRESFDPEGLRARLAAALPPWMVPSVLRAVPALPRTIAGKVDRRALLALLPREDRAAADHAPLAPAELVVAEAFAAVLGGGPYGRDVSFSASGGDSLRAIRLLGRLRRDGLALEFRDLLAADSVAAVARAGRRDTEDDRGIVSGPVPLTPVQRWYFDRDPEGRATLNHLVLLRCPAGPDLGEALATAVDALCRHHDALRTVYARDGARWSGHCPAPDGTFAVRTVDLCDAVDPWPALRADALAEQPRPPGRGGPLFRATRYRLAEADHLLLAAHHLVVDAVSWRIILDDLETALRQVRAGDPVRLPGKTTAYRDWARALAGPEVLAAAERERPHWDRVARGGEGCRPVAAPSAGSGTRAVSADLGAVDPAMPDRRVLAELLARLGAALLTRDSRAAAVVMLSHHGRHPPTPGLDASRTVGWFTADFPFLLDCRATADEVEAALVAVPSHGTGWGVLRWFGAHPVALPEPEFHLNYLGAVDPPPDTGLVLCDGLPAVTREGLPTPHSIEIEVAAAAGRLAAAFRYAPARHPSRIVEGLIDAMSLRPASHPAIKASQTNRREPCP